MKYYEHRPPLPLADHVDYFWLVNASDAQFPRQTLFPDGGVTILFNLADPHCWIDRHSGERRTYRDAWIAGERVEPYLLESTGRTHIAGIRFCPGGARPFIPMPANELTGLVVPLDQIFGPIAHRYHHQLLGATDTTEVFNTLREFLTTAHGALPAGGNSLVNAAIRAINGLGPSASIVRLANQLGTSHRSLLRHFDSWVGLKPKMLQRIIRFQRAIRMEDAARHTDWSTIAYRCGYYDQAHLIRDFKCLSGITPKRYRELRLEYPNYVPEV